MSWDCLGVRLLAPEWFEYAVVKWHGYKTLPEALQNDALVGVEWDWWLVEVKESDRGFTGLGLELILLGWQTFRNLWVHQQPSEGRCVICVGRLELAAWLVVCNKDADRERKSDQVLMNGGMEESQSGSCEGVRGRRALDLPPIGRSGETRSLTELKRIPGAVGNWLIFY